MIQPQIEEDLSCYSFYLHELSPPAGHLTELHACCEMLKGEGRGGTKRFKNTEVMDCCGRQFAAPSARATGLTKFSSAQEGASQLSVKACDWQSFSFKRGMPRKDKESSWDREMEAVAQNWRALQAEQVSVGSSLLSYMTGDRNIDVRKSSSRKYLWRENAKMKLFFHRMYTQWIENSG